MSTKNHRERPLISPSVRRFVGLLSPVRGAIALVGLLTAVSIVISALAPLVLARATDTLVSGVVGRMLPSGQTKEQAVERLREAGQSDFAGFVSGMDLVPGEGVDFVALGRLLTLAVVMYLVVLAMQMIAAQVLNKAIHQVIRTMRRDIEHKIHRLPVSVADASPRGDLLSRTTNDVDNVTSALTQALSQLMRSVLTAVSVVVMMLYISPLLTLAALVVLPIGVVVTRRLMVRAQASFLAQMQHMGAMSMSMDESLNGHQITTAFGREQERIAAFRASNDELAKASSRAQVLSGMASPIMGFVGHLSYVLICVIGGLRVATGTMTIGEVQAFLQYGRQFSGPVAEISGLVNEIQAGIASSDRVHEFLELPEEHVGVPVEHAPAGHVRMSDVTFGYTADAPVLRGVDLSAAPGETVAVVGPSGAGKTTLVNLLLRFYDPQSGSITIDGQDITEMDRADVRSRIGMVLQDAWLFEGTVRENIAYGAAAASDAEIEEAARLAHLDGVLGALPDALDQKVEADGDNLSAGERQLITIARAFVSRPEILVLDEATSAVDSRTEMLVQQALGSLRRGRTSIVIAHRLATVRSADRVVVIEDGSVSEVGTHDSLVATGGTYARMAKAQEARVPEPVG